MEIRGTGQILKRILDGKPVIIPGDGSSLWTLTHSKDFAKGYVGLMANPHAIGNAFHITTDESMTWNQIYQTIARCAGETFEQHSMWLPIFLRDMAGTMTFGANCWGTKPQR